MDGNAVLERGQVLPRRFIPAQLRGLATRVVGALPLLDVGSARSIPTTNNHELILFLAK